MANFILFITVFFVNKDYVRLLQLLFWIPFLFTFVLTKRRWSGLKFYLPVMPLFKVIAYVVINNGILEEALCKNDTT
jgi:hypothetical protein